MSGGSAVKTAVGRGGSPGLHDRREEERGNAPRRPEGLVLTARGTQAPQSKPKEVSRRLVDSSCASDCHRMDETWSGSVSAIVGKSKARPANADAPSKA